MTGRAVHHGCGRYGGYERLRARVKARRGRGTRASSIDTYEQRLFGEPRAINSSHPREVWLHPRQAGRQARRFGLLAAIMWTAARAQTAQPVRHFDIPAEPLAPALTLFARQADVTLLSSASAVDGLRARGVHGEFTVMRALGMLLKESGLTFRLVGRSAIAVVAAPQRVVSGQVAGRAGARRALRSPHLARRPERPPEERRSWGTLRPQPDRLTQVLITATKRTTTLQSTPASVTAVTAANISRRGLADFDSLARSIPGLAVRTAGPGQTEFEMRGLNSSGGNTSMVGLYLGEIPLSAPASAQLGKVLVDLDLYDIERVEVLRGPQGTLYGASSMGGTVRLVPQAPRLGRFEASGETVVSATGSGGGFNHALNGMVNLPFGSKAALRLVGSIRRESGWIERRVIADGAVAVDAGIYPKVSRPPNFYSAPLQEQINGVNTTDVDAARAELLIKPMRHLSILSLAIDQLTRQGGPDAVDVNGEPIHPVMPAVEAHWEIYGTPEPQRDRFALASLDLVYHLPSLRVSTATGYWARSTVVSQDGTEETAAAMGASFPAYDPPGGLGPTGPSPLGPGTSERDDTRQLSEELRVTSASAGPWQWLAGWFYQDLHSDWQLSVLAPQAEAALGGPNIYVDHQPQDILQNSEFGELSWRIAPQLVATVSLRHYRYALHQSNSEYGQFTVFGAQGNTTPYNTSASNGAAGTVPEFDLRYTFGPQFMLYATASQGFRLGGVNQPIPVAHATNSNAVLVANECGLQEKLLGVAAGGCDPNVLLQAPVSFSSDSVWSYELGEKSTLLHRRLTLDLSAYYERWIHPQLATNLAGFGITANGADARIEGLEAEVHALLGRDWHLSANAAYTDATFTHASAIIGYPAGTRVPDTPTIMGSAVLRWRHDLSASLAGFASIGWDYEGSRTDAPYGETITLWNIDQYMVHLPAYSLTDVRLGLESGRWRAALFVDNLTNARVLLDPQPQINLQTAAFTRYTVNRPITVGLDLIWRFR